MINLNSVDNQAIRALLRLLEPGNEAMLKLIESQVAETKQKLVKADDMVVIHRLQGRAEAFEDLLKAVEDARKIG